MRLYLFLATLTVVICVQLPISAQSANNRNQRVSLIRSPKTRAMAAAFKSGKLPDPLRLPTGNIDQHAAALAQAVALKCGS